MRPLVTIGIPTRNRLKYLKTTLASALAQPYGPLEIIVSNNRSADDTALWLQSVTDPRVRILETAKDLTMSENCNHCLAEARGEFFIWLSDDDALSPHYIANAVAQFEQEPSLVGYYGHGCSINASVEGPFVDPAHTGRAEHYPGAAFAQLFLASSEDPKFSPSIGGFPIATTFSLLCRTAALRAAGGMPTKLTNFYADMVFCLGVWVQGTIALDRKSHFFYRHHETNSYLLKNWETFAADVDAFWTAIETAPIANLFAQHLTPTAILTLKEALIRFKFQRDMSHVRYLLNDDPVGYWMVVAQYPKEHEVVAAHIASKEQEIRAVCQSYPEQALTLAGMLLTRYPTASAFLIDQLQKMGLRT